jgi:beta-glucosidase
MTKKIILFCIVLMATFSAFSTSITSVKVSGVRGYEIFLGAAGSDTGFYMGRIDYIYKAQGKDSVFVDFSITKQGSTDALPILEKKGDVGIVKQANAGDTLKTAYFRTRLVGDNTGNYVATITAEANMSAMWKLADSLVKLMTNDQKNTLLYSWTNEKRLAGFGSDDFKLADGTVIVGWRSADGPNGIRFPVTGTANPDIAIYGSGDPATVFATEAARGCTWDTTIARRVGQAIGEEARAMGLYCNLGPMSDLVVNPRWGRAFETMGEDPYLVGKMASSQVKGIQNAKVIATPKHFTPYCKEDGRRSGLRITVSERALRELFCVPFEMDIKDGGARAIMTCYNKVRVPGFTTENQAELENWCDRAATNRHLIHDILRNDWGFDGVIMTDWLGSYYTSPEYSFNTDFDWDMPNGPSYMKAAENIKNGQPGWTEAQLNKKALNVMYANLWAWNGKLLPNDDAIKTFPQSAILSQDHLNLTLDEARESIVLTKNDPVNGSPVLPLDKNGTFKLAVVGPFASMYRSGGGGSSAVTPDSQISPLTGITRFLTKSNSKISLVTDYTGADAAIVFVGIEKEQEDSDRDNALDMRLPADQLTLVTSVMSKVKKTVVVYTGGSASVAGSWSDAPAILIAFYPGRNQAQAMAEILFGDVNPSGHLCVTFPKTPTDLPTYELTDMQYYYPSADTAHGYFYFEKTGKTPLYWFGHGLSYTSFNYLDMAVRGSSNVASGERFDVKVTLKNSGAVSGSDVVQLYVKPINSTVPRRVKDLRGFSRVALGAGETKSVTFTLEPRDFSVYDVNATAKTGQWKVVPGTYDLIASSTSNPADLAAGNGKCLIKTITIQ